MIDASACVWSVVPLVAGLDVAPRFTRWRRDGVALVAPTLWLPECASAIRGLVYAGRITSDEGRRSLERCFDVGVELVEMDQVLGRAALDWADRLGQRRAYDAFYVALAERIGTELWTADQRLANAAVRSGLRWVRWIGAA